MLESGAPITAIVAPPPDLHLFREPVREHDAASMSPSSASRSACAGESGLAERHEVEALAAAR